MGRREEKETDAFQGPCAGAEGWPHTLFCVHLQELILLRHVLGMSHAGVLASFPVQEQ